LGEWAREGGIGERETFEMSFFRSLFEKNIVYADFEFFTIERERKKPSSSLTATTTAAAATTTTRK